MAPSGENQPKQYDGSNLRIGIVHARWNPKTVDALVAGTRKALRAAGVRDENVVVQDVAGSWELPIAVQRMYKASEAQSAASALLPSTTDLLGATSLADLAGGSTVSDGGKTSASSSSSSSTAAFDAVIAVGTLVKGETMHFEYIADAVSQGLMRVQLDCGVPVVFGLLTVLSEEQGLARAGLTAGGHNHGEDWGLAAVEMGVKRRAWAKGEMIG